MCSYVQFLQFSEHTRYSFYILTWSYLQSSKKKKKCYETIVFISTLAKHYLALDSTCAQNAKLSLKKNTV